VVLPEGLRPLKHALAWSYPILITDSYIDSQNPRESVRFCVQNICLTNKAQKHSDKASSASQLPPRVSSAQGHAPQQYSQKPAPPLPLSPRHDSYSSSSGGGLRHDSYGAGSARPDRRQSPVTQPQGNYGYNNSPPASQSRFSPDSRQTRPVASSRPPPSPAIGTNNDPSLLPLFRAVDKDGGFAEPPLLPWR
jgi:hypothetical protein